MHVIKARGGSGDTFRSFLLLNPYRTNVENRVSS